MRHQMQRVVMVMVSFGWLLVMALMTFLRRADAIPPDVLENINRINARGAYLGIVVPNNFEMSPLLEFPRFVADKEFPFLDVAGRRFRIGVVKKKNVIIVMSGLSMLNAGITTQLLVSFFKIAGVLHLGIAGNANPALQIGDVTIPQYWAHTGLWNWQRFGDSPLNELALESNGDYTRNFGYLKFSNFSNKTKNMQSSDNLLNRVWYQPEEIFPVDGYPEIRQHIFWVPVDDYYFSIGKKLEIVKLQTCVNSTCLPRQPKVVRVKRGISSNIFVDNSAYRQFLLNKFNATTIDMESAAVALVCFQQRKRFISIRALSDLAGGGSSLSNEANVFGSLAARNAVDAAVMFIAFL